MKSSFNSVDRDDFSAMIEPDRYGQRSGAFDEIISATDSHFWDPGDPRYLNFERPFNLEEELLMPESFTVELNCAAVDKMDARKRILFGNELTRFHLSQLLHGEQGALSLSASLCQIFQDPGAQEYAANQVREEARHVHALTNYFDARWGSPVPVGSGLFSLMNKLVLTGEIYQKIIGMQMLIEGLALGTFSAIYSRARDPLLKRLVQFVLTDESYHHRFGKIWGGMTIPTLEEPQQRQMENWAAGCFVTVFQNLSGLEQKQDIYAKFGLNWKWVSGAMREALQKPEMTTALNTQNIMYRVLAKTLMETGIITGRTRPLYAAYFDLNTLMNDPEDLLGDGIADQTITELRDIHREIRRPRRQLNK